jgi:hypothetical protein
MSTRGIASPSRLGAGCAGDGVRRVGGDVEAEIDEVGVEGDRELRLGGVDATGFDFDGDLTGFTVRAGNAEVSSERGWS